MAPRLALVALLAAFAPTTLCWPGVVGTNDDFQISLSDASGPVKHLDAWSPVPSTVVATSTPGPAR